MLMISTLIFVAILAVSFAVLFWASRPTKAQKLIAARVDKIIEGIPVQPTDNGSKTSLLKGQSGDETTWLTGIPGGPKLHRHFRLLTMQADSSMSAEDVVIRCALFAAAGVGAGLLLHLGLLFVAGITLVAGYAPVFLLRFKRSRKLKAFNEGLPDSIDLMARALRAGHSVASAIEVISEQGAKPVSTEFGLVYKEQNFGLPFRESLMNMSTRVASQDLQFLITAMLVQKETGGNLTDILDRTTHVIRERLRIHGEVRVKTAQGRLTGWILSMLPVVLAILLNCFNPGFEKPLFEDPFGRILLYCGAGMLAVGTFVISRIVDIKV